MSPLAYWEFVSYATRTIFVSVKGERLLTVCVRADPVGSDNVLVPTFMVRCVPFVQPLGY